MKTKYFEKEFKILLNTQELEVTIDTKFSSRLFIKCLDEWIHCRFLDDSFDINKFNEIFPDNNINRHSFKWNIWGSNAIKVLKERLEKI